MTNKGSVPVADQLLTSKEAAKFLRLKGRYSFQTVERWARRGLLRAGKSGDIHVFLKQDLVDFVFSRK